MGRMTPEGLLGRRATLTVRRVGAAGALLAVDSSPDAPTILLPAREVAPDLRAGDDVAVFVYRDSDERPAATTTPPRLALGEVAFLEVTACVAHGAFVDWGLGKELLVPFAEQTRELTVGAWHPFGLYLDKSARLAATMRVGPLLTEGGDFALDQWVDGVAWREDPGIGLFVIIERVSVGLMPASEPHQLARGEAARFRVANLLPDGKLVLSLRGHAHHELENDAATILAILARPDTPRVGDRSSPDQIRALFGLSKKAFKRAVGRLLKERALTIDAHGFLVRR